MGDYSSDPIWEDVVPLPQDDGGPNPLAAISYTEGYAEATSYLRAVMAANEMSPRALDLTADIIAMNPAHYTVWLYRAKILRTLALDLREEIEWLNEVALAHQKNYQIWHHRQYVLDTLNDPAGEVAFINAMLKGDAKNYHVWSYRQWLVRRFSLWTTTQDNGRAELAPVVVEGGSDDEDDKDDDAPDLVSSTPAQTTELEETALYIDADVRNNSAWNHRFFVVNGDEAAPGVKDSSVYDREVKFAQDAIRKAPQNQSPWNYLRGVVEQGKGKEAIFELEGFCKEFVDLGEGSGGDKGQAERVRSSHALDLLAEIWGREEKTVNARRAYELLAGKYDPIRENYWNWLKGRLGSEGEAVA